jgi:hypothetical protein
MNSRISELPETLRLGLFAALAGLSVICLEFGTEARREWQPFPPPLARPLPPELTRVSLAAALGDQARMAADWGYIDCLQYIGGRNQDDGNWGQTLPLYREVQWLDPGFKHAVLEGVSALGWLFRRPAEAQELAQAALAADRREARYGAYIAALAYQKRLDTAGVIKALEPEVQRPDAPEMLLRMVGNLILKQGDWSRTLAYWTWVEGRAKDPNTLDMAVRTEALARRHLQGPSTPAPTQP